MAAKVRVTHRTDTRGTVLEAYRGLYATQALDAARRAGIPERYLHRAGWDGNEDDLTGFFSEAIYELGDYLTGLEPDLAKVGRVLALMEQICQSEDVDRRSAIPYEAARFLRKFSEARARRAAILRGDPLPLASEADVCWGQW